MSGVMGSRWRRLTFTHELPKTIEKSATIILRQLLEFLLIMVVEEVDVREQMLSHLLDR